MKVGFASKKVSLSNMFLTNQGFVHVSKQKYTISLLKDPISSKQVNHILYT